MFKYVSYLFLFLINISISRHVNVDDVNDVNIGSHNSLSIDVKENSNNLNIYEKILKNVSPAFWKSLIITQNKNVSTQIQNGVSALDLRLARYDDKIYITHKDIVETFTNFVKDIEIFSKNKLPIIFLVIDYSFHEKSNDATKTNLLNDAVNILLENNYPSKKIYKGLVWSNIVTASGEYDRVVRFYKTCKTNIKDYKNFLDKNDDGRMKVIFTQDTMNISLFITDLVIRLILPLVICILYITFKKRMSNWYSPFIILLIWLIIQYFIPGLYNTPETLHTIKDFDALKSLANTYKHPENIIFMVDFFNTY